MEHPPRHKIFAKVRTTKSKDDIQKRQDETAAFYKIFTTNIFISVVLKEKNPTFLPCRSFQLRNINYEPFSSYIEGKAVTNNINSALVDCQ